MTPANGLAGYRGLLSHPVANGRIHGIALFLFCSFPYVSLVRTPFDTQPYAAMAALLTLLYLFTLNDGIRTPKLLLPFGIVLIFSMVMLSVNSDILLAFRSLAGYASVFLIAFSAFLTFRYVKAKHFMIVVLIWLVFGIIQLIGDKGFGSFLLSRLETSETRGVTSLAVEPSLYSVICICFYILNDIFWVRKAYSRRVYLSIFLIITIQVFFARAGLGVVLFFIYLLAKMVSQPNVLRMFRKAAMVAFIFLLFVFFFQSNPSLQATRVGALLSISLTNPASLVSSDYSITDRLGHILVSHLSIFHSHVIGFGPGNWDVYADNLIDDIGGFAYELSAVHMTTNGGRIMSGWGTAIFELGVVGVLFLGAFIYMMYKGWKRVDKDLKKVYVSSFITIYFVMLMAVPIAFPFFGYLIGIFVYLQISDEKSESGRYGTGIVAALPDFGSPPFASTAPAVRN